MTYKTQEQFENELKELKELLEMEKQVKKNEVLINSNLKENIEKL